MSLWTRRPSPSAGRTWSGPSPTGWRRGTRRPGPGAWRAWGGSGRPSGALSARGGKETTRTGVSGPLGDGEGREGTGTIITTGVEIGQKRDPAAVCGAETDRREIEERTESDFLVRRLECLQLGTSDPQVAERGAESNGRLQRQTSTTVMGCVGGDGGWPVHRRSPARTGPVQQVPGGLLHAW